MAVRAGVGVARVSVSTRDVDAIFARSRGEVFSAGAIAMVVALGLAALFSTHPPTGERVSRLRAMDPEWKQRVEAA